MNTNVKKALLGSVLLFQIGAVIAATTDGVNITGITVNETGPLSLKFSATIGTGCMANNHANFSESFTATNLAEVSKLAHEALTTGRTVYVVTDDSSCAGSFPVTVQKIRSLRLN